MAAGFVLLAILIRWGMKGLGIHCLFLPFFLTVLASSALRGWKSGAFALVLSAAAANYFYTHPARKPEPSDADYIGQLVIFLVSSSVVILITEIQRATQRKAEALVEELKRHISRDEETQNDLAESEERYRSLFENNHDAVFTMDLQGFFITANPSALKLTGYSLEELQGMHFTALCRPGHCQEAVRHFEMAVLGEGEAFFEISITSKEGRHVELFVTGGPMKVKGKIEGVFAITADITERKRAQTRLTAFSKLGQRLSSVTTPLEAGRIIGDIAENLFGWESFSLNLYSPETNQADYVLNVDTFEGQKTEVLPFRSYNGIPPLEHRVMVNGPELVVNGSSAGIDLNNLVETASCTGMMMLVPITDHDKTIGVLSIGKRQGEPYDEQDLKTLLALADYCGGALQRIRARDALLRNEQEYRTLFDSDGSGKCQADARTARILRVNPKFCELTGRAERDLIGKKVCDFIHPDDLNASHTEFAQLARGDINEFRIEKRFERSDGSICWVDSTVTLARDEQGLPSSTMSTCVDITERKAAEEALALSNERLSLIARVTSAVLGNEPLAEQMRNVAETVRTAYGVGACIIRTLEENEMVLLACAGVPANALTARLPTTCEISQEILRRRGPLFIPDLRTFSSITINNPPTINGIGFISYVGAPLLAQDKVIGLVGIFTQSRIRDFSPVDLQHLQIIANHIAVAIANARLYDELSLQKTALEQEVNERQQAESEVHKLNADLELRVQERTRQLRLSNAELEAFAYSVSHDLRGPLRSVVGFAEALKDEHDEILQEEGREYLRRILQAGREMDELIDDLLHLSRLTRIDMKRQPVNLTLLAEGIIGRLRESSPERDVSVSLAPGLIVPADARLMRVVLENLLNNAWKFTSRTDGAQIEFGRMAQSDGAVFFVRDNGAGFDMAFANKLFGAFQRLHSTSEFPGHGIGLATVQRIIHRHGGRTWAEGHVDHGASFFFTLPV